MARSICRTRHLSQALDADRCTAVYDYLLQNLDWDEGVRSRKGFTRLAAALSLEDDPIVKEMVLAGLEALGVNGKYQVAGVYANLYADGEHWTPSHSHKGSHQMIIAFGASRTLKIGQKSYSSGNGDVTLFGSSTHGIAKEPAVKSGRISLATFMVPAERAAVVNVDELTELLALLRTGRATLASMG